MEIENLVHRKVQHNGNHDVDQIVAHQDGGKQLLGNAEQLLHTLAAVCVLDVVDILGAQREIGDFAARVESRQEKSQDGDYDGDDATRSGSVESNKRISARCAKYR